jgi:hypothetical protein
MWTLNFNAIRDLNNNEKGRTAKAGIIISFTSSLLRSVER